MTEFILDTSGHFHVMPGHPLHRFMARNIIEWFDLDPFTQGYVEAIKQAQPNVYPTDGPKPPLFWKFSDLSPEALAMILADCAAFLIAYPPGEDYTPHPEVDGRYFWRDRQAGLCVGDFPPLTVSLGDDGKVHLTVAS